MAQKKKKPAGRKRARRSASRTTASAAHSLKTIQYFCNGLCTAKAKKKHVNRNDIVVLVADGTSVTINFVGGTSPFVSGVNPINIAADTARFEVVSNTAPFASYDYALSCGSCPSGVDNPELIVDP